MNHSFVVRIKPGEDTGTFERGTAPPDAEGVTIFIETTDELRLALAMGLVPGLIGGYGLEAAHDTPKEIDLTLFPVAEEKREGDLQLTRVLGARQVLQSYREMGIEPDPELVRIAKG